MSRFLVNEVCDEETKENKFFIVMNELNTDHEPKEVLEVPKSSKLKVIDGTWMGFNSAVMDQVKKRENVNDKLKFIGIVWDNVSEIYQLKYADNNMRYKKCKNAYLHYFEASREFGALDLTITPSMLRSLYEEDSKNQICSKVMKIFRTEIKPLIYVKNVDEEGFYPSNKGVYILLQRMHKNKVQNFQVEIPDSVQQVYKINIGKEEKIILIEDIITYCMHTIIDNIKSVCYVSVCRNSVFMYNSLNSMSLKKIVKENIDALSEQWITSITYTNPDYSDLVRQLLSGETKDNTTIKLTDNVALGRLKDLDFNIGEKSKKHKSKTTYPEDIFEYLKTRPMLLHHPFDAFKSVEDFIYDGARDPKVLSIKMTLYRIPKKSKIISHLLEAKSNGKSVTIFIELKASSSEKDNLEIANLLKAAGIDIIFGNKNTKTHTKMCVITRRESGKLVHYAHVGTGNYSSSNSKSYTDYSYFVSGDVANEVNEYFKYIASSVVKLPKMKSVIATPKISKKIISLIDQEIAKGKEGFIGIKCNGIDDKDIVKKLKEAIKAEVTVHIIARSCNPIKINQFETPNLIMKSVVGELLEHSRVYIFGSNSRTVIIGSADLMKRNLNTRKELLVQVDHIVCKNQLITDFNSYMKDTENSYYIGNAAKVESESISNKVVMDSKYDVQAAMWK